MAIEKKTANNPKLKKCESGGTFGIPKKIFWANKRNSLRRLIATEVGEKNRLVRVNAKLKGYVDAQSQMIGKIFERDRDDKGFTGKKRGTLEGRAVGGWGLGKRAARPRILGRKNRTQSFYLSPTGKNGIFDNEILRDKVVGPQRF
jgi:hypothetical protein